MNGALPLSDLGQRLLAPLLLLLLLGTYRLTIDWGAREVLEAFLRKVETPRVVDVGGRNADEELSHWWASEASVEFIRTSRFYSGVGYMRNLTAGRLVHELVLGVVRWLFVISLVKVKLKASPTARSEVLTGSNI